MWKLRGGKKKSFFSSKINSEAGEKKRNGSIPFIRSNSGATLKDVVWNGDDLSPEDQYRSRSHTFTSGVPPKLKKKSSRSRSTPVIIPQPKCPEDIYSSKEDMSITFCSPRHFLRRRALVESEMEEDLSLHGLTKQMCAQQAGHHTDKRGTHPEILASQSPEEDAGKIMVAVEDGDSKLKELITVQEDQSLRSLLAPLLPASSLAGCEVSATSPNGSYLPVDLNAPSTHYAACKVLVEVKTQPLMDTSASPEQQQLFTVQQCLDYFQQHGLVELPNMVMEEDSYHLPRVPLTEPIASSWKDLPIGQQARNSLTGKALDQQQALWELIYTEHSHLRQLEVIINLFMRCLELLRRANILTETAAKKLCQYKDSYHNMFGYMEDVYNAHEQFWTWTLQPCLEKVYETSLPLDIEEIIRRFPKPQFGTHFEIYEQHCALQSFNLHSLHKASNNEDFSTYLKWCESHPECHRLKLKDFLVMPMQRLTKYSLLISAILKETTEPTHRESLEHLVTEVSQFVQSVNQMVAAQEETERVKEAMNQIVGYQAVEIPSELKELMTSYTHLDLLAPMPDVEVDKSRVLMLEGNLKYREQHNTNRMVVHVFLFTDMLLLTKAIRKSAGKHYTVVKPPYKITSLVLHSSEPGSFCVLVLNEYRLITGWFTLKAHSEEIAQEWMKQINAAQQFYTEAVERKAQNWKLIQSLKSERILNGIEQHLDSLNMATGLSQSLWSINSNQSHCSRSMSLTASNESILLPERCSPSISSEQIHHKPIGQTLSTGTKMKLHSQPNVQTNGEVDFSASLPSWLERTTSLNTLFENPESGFQSSFSNSCQRIKKMVARDTRTFPRFRSKSMEPPTHTHKSLAELFKLPSSSPVSDVSADSGSEGDPAIIDISGVEEGKFTDNTSNTEGTKCEDSNALDHNSLEHMPPNSSQNAAPKISPTEWNATPFKSSDPYTPAVTIDQPKISEAQFTNAKDCKPSDPILAVTIDQPEISEVQFTDTKDGKPSNPILAVTIDQPEISEPQFTNEKDCKPSDPTLAVMIDQPEISEANFTDAKDGKPSDPTPAVTIDQPEISEAQFTNEKDGKPSDPTPAVTIDQPEISEAQFTNEKECKPSDPTPVVTIDQPEISEVNFIDAKDGKPSDPTPAVTIDQPEISEAQFTNEKECKPSDPTPAVTIDQPEISEANFTDAKDGKPSDPTPAVTIDQPEISEAQFTNEKECKPSDPTPVVTIDQPEISEANFTDAKDGKPSDPTPAVTIDQPEISEAQFTNEKECKPSDPTPAVTIDQPEISEANFTDAKDGKPSDPTPAVTIDQPEISEAQFTNEKECKPSDPTPAVTIDQPEISEAQFTDANDCKHEVHLSVQSHEEIEKQLPISDVNHKSMPEQPEPNTTFDVVLVESNHSKSSPFLKTAEGNFQGATISSITQKLPVSVQVQSSSEPESTSTLATDGQMTKLMPSVPKKPTRKPKSVSEKSSSQKHKSKSIMTSTASSQIPRPAQTSQTSHMGTGESLPHTTLTSETEPQKVASKPKVTFSDEAQPLHKMQRSSDVTGQLNPKSHSEARSTSPDRRLSLPVFSRSIKAGMRHVPPAYKRYTGKSVKQLSEIFEESAVCTERTTSPKKVATTEVSTKPAAKPKPTPSTSTGTKGAAGQHRSDPSKKRPEVARKPISRLHQSKSALALRRSSTIGATSTTASQKRVSQPTRAEIGTKLATHGSPKHKRFTTTGISSKPAKTTRIPPISNANGSMQQKSMTRESPGRGKKSKATIHTQGQTSHIVQVSAIRAIKGRKSPAEWDNFGLSWSNAGKKCSGGTLDSHTHSDCSFVTTTVTVVVQPEP